MTATRQSPHSELDERVLEQICALNQAAVMNDCDILEFHLRHRQIMRLYRQSGLRYESGRRFFGGLYCRHQPYCLIQGRVRPKETIHSIHFSSKVRIF